MSSTSGLIWRMAVAALAACVAFGAHADTDDPPTRVARLAYLQGGVSFRPAGADDWIEAGLNRPLTIGDQLWADRGGRIEMQLDGSNLRMGSETSAGILNLTDDTTQIQLSSGTLIVHVRELADNESYEIDTPNVAFSILRPGTYRLNVDANGTSTAISVRSGQGEAVGTDGTGYTVRAGEYDTFAGTDQIDAASAALGPQDEFDAWSADRDGRFDHSQSAQYVSNDVVGYEELDNQGNWDDTPEYGHVWFPTSVEVGWAPYQRGHWAYVAPWGYTWIDDRPWGFAPFHYGRWVYWRQRWGWVPVPPPAPRTVYVRPVYAPALVAWVGGGATVAWFPLAPREVYVPSYPVSRRYLNVVNVSNTRVNTTIINNVYNTTVINRTTINNVTYANRRVPGAVMTTSSQDFASARPVRRAGGEPQALANAPVRAFAPAVVPTRAAVYGGRAPATLRPSQAVETRVTAARMAPAAAPPSVDARLQALRNGQAPNRVPAAQVAPARAPQVRVVPPVRTLVSSRDFESARPQNAPAMQQAGSARPPAHAGEIPASPRAPSPAGANSVLERQQSQEQQQLQARQDADRLRLQQQQDQQHRQLQNSPAVDVRRQQLDQEAAQRQAQSQASAELARRQQLDQQRQDQQRNAQLEQIQAQQRAQADAQTRVQQQAQAQAEQQRAAQQAQQRELEQQVQQQRNAQLQAQQRAQAEQQAQQARIQQQAQAETQRNQQLQYQRQQQALESQRQERERQLEQQHQQQTQQLQQQQQRAREELQERQQAAQRQQEQQRRPTPPPSQNPRQQ